ncbi:MAG: response regulator [Alphaproteobacteria bacterium]
MKSARLRVLVVDDSPTDRCLMAAFVESFGWHPVIANDGVAGVALARREDFDALVFDHNMPAKTGLQAINQIRREPGPNRRTPALIWTAGDLRQLAAAAAGIDGLEVVNKPLSRAAFGGWVRRVCGLDRQVSARYAC